MLAPFVPLAFSQATSPSGSITVRGRRATFRVDYPRPLESVVRTFYEQYGWAVTFEEVVHTYPRDIIDVTKNPAAGVKAYVPRGGVLEFSYDLGPGGGPPENPGYVLRKALANYHYARLPGRYQLLEKDDYFHIVPTEAATETGVFEPFESPFESVVSIEKAQRSPEEALRALVAATEVASGLEIGVVWSAFLNGEFPTIERGFDRMKARAVLRAIIHAAGRQRIWYLMYAIALKRYFLSVI